jgi:hypothetical protein
LLWSGSRRWRMARALTVLVVDDEPPIRTFGTWRALPCCGWRNFNPFSPEHYIIGADPARTCEAVNITTKILGPSSLFGARAAITPFRPSSFWRARLAVKSRKTPCRQTSGTADLVTLDVSAPDHSMNKRKSGSHMTRRWREMDSNFQFPVAKPRSASRHGGPSWLLGYGSGSVGDRRFESISLQRRV